MNALMLDSNAIIDLFNGVGRTLEWIGKAERILIPSALKSQLAQADILTQRHGGTEIESFMDAHGSHSQYTFWVKPRMRFQRHQKPFSNVLRASAPLCDTLTATFRFSRAVNTR